MCGIFFYLSKFKNYYDIQQTKQLIDINKLNKKRGPDNMSYSSIISNKHKYFLGFNRLAINGLDELSNQPIEIELLNKNTNTLIKYVLICNGEIYNYKDIANEFDFEYKTNSDCESIIHLIHYLYTEMNYSLDSIISKLDGVFAFVLYIDNDVHNNSNPGCIIARDRFGVRPLYEYNNDYCYGVSSTLESCVNIDTNATLSYNIKNKVRIKQFPPGNIKYISSNTYTPDSNILTEKILLTEKIIKYYNINSIKPNGYMSFNKSLYMVKSNLYEAVKKRVLNTNRPIACLLSGGLDSSLITSLVSKITKQLYGTQHEIETYSIGLQGSVDLKYARKVSEYLGTKHTEIVVSEEEFLDAIPDVISHIESYDTTTVRASVGNYLVSKYISENSSSGAKVIFNGDGSDELTGGYMYFYESPTSTIFDIECKRLLTDIHYFDVLRSDRSISSNGLEARTPFLDHTFVQTYLSIPIEYRRPNKNNSIQCEKYLLRKAFDDGETLPKEVLWRTKEAFSDGVSSKTRSWYEIIQEKIPQTSYYKSHSNGIQTLYNNYKMKTNEYINIPNTIEKSYYRYIFKMRFLGVNDDIIPYYWMPRFIQANDASARTLKIYDNIEQKQKQQNEQSQQTNEMDIDE